MSSLSLSPELGEGKKDSLIQCLKPCSPKPHSVRLRMSILTVSKQKMFRYLCCDPVDQLQVGNGPETGMAEKWLAKWPAAIFTRGPKMAEKWPCKWANRQKMAKFQLSGHLPSHFSAILPPPLPKNGRRPFRQPLFGHFQFRARFPPVAGQRGRNTCDFSHTVSHGSWLVISRLFQFYRIQLTDLLTFGSFLLAMELFYLCVWELFCLQLEFF